MTLIFALVVPAVFTAGLKGVAAGPMVGSNALEFEAAGTILGVGLSDAVVPPGLLGSAGVPEVPPGVLLPPGGLTTGPGGVGPLPLSAGCGGETTTPGSGPGDTPPPPPGVKIGPGLPELWGDGVGLRFVSSICLLPPVHAAKKLNTPARSESFNAFSHDIFS